MLDNPFSLEYNELSESQKEFVRAIKIHAGTLFNQIDSAAGDETFTSDPRNIALAKTRLEEAVMWAVKGITNPVEKIEKNEK